MKLRLNISSVKVFFAFITLCNMLQAQEMLCPAKLKTLWGYIDTKGTWIIKPVYTEAGNFNEEGLAVVKQGKDKFLLIDRKGKIVSNKVSCGMEFKTTKSLYVKISNPDKGVGYTDYKGNWKIDPHYTKAWDFSEGLAFVNQGGEYLGFGTTDGCSGRTSIIDTSGNFVADAGDMTSFGPFKDGIATTGHCYGQPNTFLTNKGEFIGKSFSKIMPFGEGLAPVEMNPDTTKFDYFWGYIDKTGKIIIQPRFEYPVFPFKEGLALISYKRLINYYTDEYDEKWGFINMKGDTAIAVQYLDALNFSEGLAPVCDMEKKWGYIGKQGETVIPFQFEKAEEFKKGRAKIKTEGKWGFINPKGEIIIPAKFDEAGSFN
jgi:hypothetical protein